ncbi:alpha/beta fold hydrolase [Streptomyces sp. NPDC018693]|uniref:alpha/beta fold hydrolase n=1 Tax=unclassified Streptomyces TaxID=2593676 RepID=UPI0037B38DFB
MKPRAASGVVHGEVRLAYRDYGGDGTPVLLLHGLAGHMGEWDALAELLLPRHRVIAYDARAHGASERQPTDVSRAAYVRDVVAVIGQLLPDSGPVVLVGQSLGGHTAMLTAAAHPGLVRALILIEAGPDGPVPDLPGHIGQWLSSWPVPFESPSAAARFFGGSPAAAHAWASGLEPRDDGLHPRFDPALMTASVAELAHRNYWRKWDDVICPALVVRGDDGDMCPEEATSMASRRPGDTTLRVVRGAGHDVHLDRPELLHEVIDGFLTPRSYRYVGPAALLAAALQAGGGGARTIRSPADFDAWVREQPASELDEPFTFVVDMEGFLRLAPRRSEHVVCAGGGRVLGAGEVAFTRAAGVWMPRFVSNQSTGYCPDGMSWLPVAAALRRAGVAAYSDGFHHEVVFRRCERCQEHNIVREDDFVCVFCGAELPETWNVDAGDPMAPPGA